eukprot:m51a1_g7353 hypothetical protein (318) ;mRNA; f:25696-27149
MTACMLAKARRLCKLHLSSRYYVYQDGWDVVWVGEYGPKGNSVFCNVVFGRIVHRQGTWKVHLEWADVPKGVTRNRGRLTFGVQSVAPGAFNRMVLLSDVFAGWVGRPEDTRVIPSISEWGCIEDAGTCYMSHHSGRVFWMAEQDIEGGPVDLQHDNPGWCFAGYGVLTPTGTIESSWVLVPKGNNSTANPAYTGYITWRVLTRADRLVLRAEAPLQHPIVLRELVQSTGITVLWHKDETTNIPFFTQRPGIAISNNTAREIIIVIEDDQHLLALTSLEVSAGVSISGANGALGFQRSPYGDTHIATINILQCRGSA